ncbi:MAG: hypothetical protein XXXJIFNMEKO3_02829 [Candidatus Erwinia impunctatus]|nr:hypothetical protein XXXJIFNMEKO_02829 [Culicoides impunctatus]
MNITPALTAGLETILNRVLYHDRGLKTVRQRLVGKSLTISLAELRQPLTLVFSEQQIDVVGEYADTADCTLQLSLSVLPELRDRQQLTRLIRQGSLDVEGDLQVVQNFSALLDLAELDPAEYLAPWTGDLIAQTVCQTGLRLGQIISHTLQRQQQHLAEVLTEEWRVAPARLEQAWFADEVEALTSEATLLEHRLNQLEAQ